MLLTHTLALLVCSVPSAVFAGKIYDDISQLKLVSSVKEHRKDAYVFTDVCTTMNTMATDQEDRGLLFLDPSYDHAKRCVACNNPVMAFVWDKSHVADRPGIVIPGDYVRDTSGIDSGRWKKDGGLLSKGGHKCGMMWVHKTMAKNLADYNECTASNLQEIKDRGQHQVPEVIKTAEYHEEPTMMLLYKKGNPGHQLMDSLLSMYPTISERDSSGNPVYTKVINHQDWNCKLGSSNYICSLLRGIGAFGKDESSSLIDTSDVNKIHCFKKLFVPVPGVYGRGQQSMPKAILSGFRDGVLGSFGLTAKVAVKPKRKRILFYGHFSTKRRHWVSSQRLYSQRLYVLSVTLSLPHYSPEHTDLCLCLCLCLHLRMVQTVCKLAWVTTVPLGSGT
jgi:hypothetical protein